MQGGDWLSTAGTTAQITRQFAADPDAGGPGTGFCGNVVMEFAQYDKPTTFKPYGSLFPTSHRQFNLSGWKVCVCDVDCDGYDGCVGL